MAYNNYKKLSDLPNNESGFVFRIGKGKRLYKHIKSIGAVERTGQYGQNQLNLWLVIYKDTMSGELYVVNANDKDPDIYGV